MAPKKVDSRTLSCSELKDGERALLDVKKETLTKADLENQIKDHFHDPVHFCCVFQEFPIATYLVFCGWLKENGLHPSMMKWLQ